MYSYAKFLEKKLFLIETLSLRGWLKTNDEALKEVHDICLAPPSRVLKYLGEKLNEETN